MARNPGSGDGSSPAHGEFAEVDGGRPRTAKRGERVAGITTDPTSSPEMRMANDAARQALADYNSGASDASSGGISDPANLLGGGTSKPVSTCADPSSLSR